MTQPVDIETRIPETRIKVFISYSRADKAFASDLVLGLAACGFAPYIDRQDIAAGEDWEKRLAGLITDADTVVYVISPDSIGSKNCRDELDEALRLQKRILPVVWRPVDDASTAVELKRLNYIFFTGEGRTFAAGLADLAAALRTDIDWIREHTRLSELSRRWGARSRAADLLLRGDDIDAANAWLAARPITAPPITDAQADYIKASSDARIEAERRARRARAGLLTAVSAAAVVFAGLAAAAGVAWQLAEKAEGVAVGARNDADAAKAVAEASEAKVKISNLRLSAEMWLRTAPSPSKRYYVIEKGWYRVAASYSGAIARVELTGGGAGFYSTGLLIDGALVNEQYRGEPLLLVLAEATKAAPQLGGSAPGDTLATSAPPGFKTAPLPADTLQPSAPGGPRVARLPPPPPPPQAPAQSPRDTLAARADPRVQNMLLPNAADGPLKLSAIFPALTREGETMAPIAGASIIWQRAPQAASEPLFQIWRLASRPPPGAEPITSERIACGGAAKEPAGKTIAILGIGVPAEGGPSLRALALNISDLINPANRSRILYTHSTNIASGGAPVFDLTSEKIFAIHLGSEPDEKNKDLRRGYGYSVSFLLNTARSVMKSPPLCEDG